MKQSHSALEEQRQFTGRVEFIAMHDHMLTAMEIVRQMEKEDGPDLWMPRLNDWYDDFTNREVRLWGRWLSRQKLIVQISLLIAAMALAVPAFFVAAMLFVPFIVAMVAIGLRDDLVKRAFQTRIDD